MRRFALPTCMSCDMDLCSITRIEHSFDPIVLAPHYERAIRAFPITGGAYMARDGFGGRNFRLSTRHGGGVRNRPRGVTSGPCHTSGHLVPTLVLNPDGLIRNGGTIMARKNANAAKGITRGKRYRRYAPHQYGALQSSIWGTKLVRILRPTPGGFLVELPDGRAVRAMASEVLL